MVVAAAPLLGAAFLFAAPAHAQEAAPVSIGGVTYGHVDPGEPFTEAARPPQDWPVPEPAPAEAAAGMIAYVTPDPGDYKPYRMPKAEERTDSLTVSLTPGEDEPVCFGVYGLAELRGLTVRVSTRRAPVTAEVRYEHFWPQRTGWGSREWYMTPELLLPCADGSRQVPTTRGLLAEAPFDLAAGETAAFWITLSAPPDARPGTYRSLVRVESAGRATLRLPLTVEVLPFRLRRPADRYWVLYADTGRWQSMTDQQILAELRDFARHGITGLVEMPLGDADLSGLAAGKVAFDAGPFRRMAALCREAGLPGPHVCCPGGMPERVRDALGLQCDLATGTWPEAITRGVEAVARAAVAATRDDPARWYYYGVDEPSGDNTYAIQDYQCWRRGRAETYATFYNLGFLEQASEYLTAPCFVSGLISVAEAAESARTTCAQTGAEFWWYGTGCYVNPFPQEGFMFPNRYGAGLLFWKTGARAQATWTFCRPHEDVFNDFDGSAANPAEPKEQVTCYPHFLQPDDWSTYQGALPTIAWESLREGADDYAYLHTLASLIGERRRSHDPAVRARAEAAQATLDELVAGIPWANPMDGVAFETTRLQTLRRTVAELIVGLQ